MTDHRAYLSVLGEPLFVSKLWLAHDGRDVYRGFYEWDGAGLADSYVRALWWVLALVSVRGSIHYAVLPGRRRDELLHDPTLVDNVRPVDRGDWWRLTKVEAPTVTGTRRRCRAG